MNNDYYHNKVKKFLDKHSIKYKFITFKESCHSIDEAVLASKENRENFVKNICMIDKNSNLIVTIVLGENRASTSRVSKALEINRPRLATSNEVFEKTGYLAGGVPSFSYTATFLVDEKVTQKEYIITGGGSEFSLIKLNVKDLLTLNNAKVCRVRK